MLVRLFAAEDVYVLRCWDTHKAAYFSTYLKWSRLFLFVKNNKNFETQAGEWEVFK